MTLLADILSSVFERRFSFERNKAPDDRPLSELTAELIGTAGEVSGQALAREILDRFVEYDEDGKREFFRHLAIDLDIDADAVECALHACSREQSKKNYRAFMEASEPTRQELIRRLNQVPGATDTLVNMRVDLLNLSKEEPELQALDLDFRHLFVSWFNRGFLVLRHINWESPAHILEKIIAYEAVHAIDSWDDLRRRLKPCDRQCFAYFHPAMPDEPLIFVEVALTQGIPVSVQDVLAEGRTPLAPDEANTAVFYSISNCQAGLAGISFGNSLIKQVAADLNVEWPNLETFVTLSPIPEFMSWVHKNEIVYDSQDDDHIRKLVAHYLLNAKRENGYPLDPVARFHLGNGALVHQIHARADISDKGIAQSAGAMVNYLYDLEKVSQNHEKFATAKEVVASDKVSSLATSMVKLLPKGVDA